MKTFNQFINESHKSSDIVTIEELANEFSIYDKETMIDWWKENRDRIEIHYFPFKTNEPILGACLSSNSVALNEKARAPEDIKIFIMTHESYHCDQMLEGKFEEEYFKTVMDGDKETFLKNYKRLENDANNKAITAMTKMGFRNFSRMENMLRGNEDQGGFVWNMMRSDIEKYKPTSFVDLIKAQIL